jgi:hypothetical protein
MNRCDITHAKRFSTIALALPLCAAGVAFGGTHTWDVNELFTNADGTIQYVELREANGTPGELGVVSQNMMSDAHTFNINGDPITGPTSNRHYLIATQTFADLPGAPTPDAIIPAEFIPFFNLNGDTVHYSNWDSLAYGPGELPADGINSLSFDGSTGVNSPTNYAGETGTVDASGGPGEPVPTAGTWSLIIMGIVILSAGTLAMARRGSAVTA